jgi:hypothetical protein
MRCRDEGRGGRGKGLDTKVLGERNCRSQYIFHYGTEFYYDKNIRERRDDSKI